MAIGEHALPAGMLPVAANPYTRDGHGFRLVDSVVCFLDILGYRELVADGGEAAQRSFHNALAESYPMMLAEMGYDPGDDYPPLFALKTFTDNVVLARPIGPRNDGESELGNVAMAVGALQTQLALKGFFVRGGIAFGPAYVDDFGVFGDALLQAYYGECQLARDPRIILCASARAQVIQHIGYYADPAHSPQNREMRQDSDGQAFVSYLEHLAPAPYEGGFALDAIATHRDVVADRLRRFRDKPILWAKYEWVARYHNHFCERYADLCDEGYRVPLDALQRGFSDIA